MNDAAVHRTSLVLMERHREAPVMCATGFAHRLVATSIARGGRTSTPHFHTGSTAPVATTTRSLKPRARRGPRTRSAREQLRRIVAPKT